MISSLRMYEFPELQNSLDNYWNLIHNELLSNDINSPLSLDTSINEQQVWLDPNLVLAQTCGMPYRKFLHEKVTLIGTPDFGLDDCHQGYYNSVFISNINDSRKHLFDFKDAMFTYNMANSQSGLAAAYTDAKKNDFWFKRRIISGSHQKSCEMVANGKADIACIDSITWRFIEKYTSLKNQIRIISKTDPTPGLPYISSIEANQSVIFNSIKIALEKLNKNEKNILGIERIVWIAKSEYLKYENPPEDATRGDLSITPGSY